MFKKLLKYDIRAISKLWWIGAVSSVAAAIVGSVLIRFYTYAQENAEKNIVLGLISTFAIIVAVLCVAVIFLAFVFTVVLVYVRFYRHFFTDEGYLTFTLPVKRSTLFLSKTVNALIWFFAHFAVIAVSILLFAMLVCPTEDTGFFINLAVFEGIGEFFAEGWSAVGAWLIVYVIEAVLVILISLVYSITLVHFCITFGSVIAKKAKLIASIGLYYAISSTLAAIGQFGGAVIAMFMSGGMEIFMENATRAESCSAVALLILVALCVLASVAAVFYSLTQYMLDRKLNLA